MGGAQKTLTTMFDLDAALKHMLSVIEPQMGDPTEPGANELQRQARYLALLIKHLPKYLASRDTRRAALEAMKIGWLAGELYAMQFERDVQHERKRARMHRPAVEKLKNTARKKQQKVCELFAEYGPANVKQLGRKNVLKEVGTLAAEQLKLPKPIPPETVRKYLPKKKHGRG